MTDENSASAVEPAAPEPGALEAATVASGTVTPGSVAPSAVAPITLVEPPAEPAESEELVALRERLRKNERPSHIGFRTLLFVLSLGAFIYFMRDSGPVVVAIVVGVLAFHELGHFVAMKLLGYENMNVFFVPFMGAAVSGRAAKPGGWRAAVVSLAGPVPGILLAALLHALNVGSGLVNAAIFALVTVNAINLLPFVPLDGGRLMNTVLFSRHRHLELIGTIAGMFGLLAVPDLLPGQSSIWAGVFAGLLIQRAKSIDASHRLRNGNYDFEGVTSSLPAASLWALKAETQKVLEKTIATERTHTVTMASLHEAAAAKPAQWHHSVGLSLVWAAALGVAWLTWTGLKAPRWQEQIGPDQLWSVTFPAAPSCKTTPAPAEGVVSLHACYVNGRFGEFGTTSMVLLDETLRFEDMFEEADARLRNAVTETASRTGLVPTEITTTERAGMPALEVSYQAKSGPPLHALYLATGHVVHVLTTVGATPENETHFRQSFSPKRE
jgi:Zn-dependent protease